jgi:hypothetical protein
VTGAARTAGHGARSVRGGQTTGSTDTREGSAATVTGVAADGDTRRGSAGDSCIATDPTSATLTTGGAVPAVAAIAARAACSVARSGRVGKTTGPTGTTNAAGAAGCARTGTTGDASRSVSHCVATGAATATVKAATANATSTAGSVSVSFINHCTTGPTRSTGAIDAVRGTTGSPGAADDVNRGRATRV